MTACPPNSYGGPRFAPLLGGLALVLMAGEAFSGPAPQPPEPKVQFLLDTVRMVPGETAELTLSVTSNAPLKRISVSINFDETKFRRVFVAVTESRSP